MGHVLGGHVLGGRVLSARVLGGHVFTTERRSRVAAAPRQLRCDLSDAIAAEHDKPVVLEQAPDSSSWLPRAGNVSSPNRLAINTTRTQRRSECGANTAT